MAKKSDTPNPNQNSKPDRKTASSKKKPTQNGETKRKTESSSGKDASPSPKPKKTKPPVPVVVGIGASAGGLAALEGFFSNLTEQTGLAFVVVTHQDPKHTSLLPELIERCTSMPVQEVSKATKIEADTVYFPAAGKELIMHDGALRISQRKSTSIVPLPIDSFFRSLAADRAEKAVCIILSGTGTDGTLGLKAIKGESGMAMVQDSQSAKFSGMPGSAASTGLADYEIPVEKMPQALIRYIKQSSNYQYPDRDLTKLWNPDILIQIFSLLRSQTGNDFSFYKANTIRRRVERRMNVHHFNSPEQYLGYLEQNSYEVELLFRELLIGVTSFFRDPEAFEMLKVSIREELRGKPDDFLFRAWVAGCSTGEEAYSIAILVRECLDELKQNCEVQIFGTDLDSRAIDTARHGLYPDGIVADVSPERLQKFFQKEEAQYRIRKDIREMIIFAPQNVIKDPPFTKLNLVCCRNLLIYLNSELQKRLLPLFHYTLIDQGILYLGGSETIGGFSSSFKQIDAKSKIYQKKALARALHTATDLPILSHRLAAPTESVTQRSVTRANQFSLSAQLEHILLNYHVPPSVVVNESGDTVYVHGRTGRYLEPATGKANVNVLNMARQGLRLDLGAVIRKAGKTEDEVVHSNVQVKTNGDTSLVDVKAKRLSEPESVQGLIMVSFIDVEPTPYTFQAKQVEDKATASSDRTTTELERELLHTQDNLQSTIEELETTNEELKSTNEELQSTNEELQSANEELETSKEEMQSLNEELQTVNSELQMKIEDLSHSNDDMKNLLNNTEIATIFLDRELNIKRFTQQALKVVNLIQSDIGRPISDLVFNVEYDDLVSDAAEVHRTLVFKEAEVRTKDDHWYFMRIMPYRTSENVIDGLVITFVDIDKIREAESELRITKQRLTGLVENATVCIHELDLDGRFLSMNPAGLAMMHLKSEAEILNQSYVDVVCEGDRDRVSKHIAKAISGITVEFAVTVDIDGEATKFITNIIPISDESQKVQRLMGVTLGYQQCQILLGPN